LSRFDQEAPRFYKSFMKTPRQQILLCHDKKTVSTKINGGVQRFAPHSFALS
jgi:hypothetical protein